MSLTDFTNIVDAIRRGNGSWALFVESGRAVLAAGSAKCVRSGGGFIVSLGMSREELVKLRDAADEALVLIDKPS